MKNQDAPTQSDAASIRSSPIVTPARPAPDDGNGVKKRLRTARLIAILVCMPCAIAYGCFFDEPYVPINAIGGPLAIGGLVAFIIASSVGIHRRKRVAEGDVLRIVGWTLVGAGLDKGCAVGGYYNYGYPGYGPLAEAVSMVAFFAGLALIPLSFILHPSPPPPQPGLCRKCGYDLRGLPEDRCPECGQPFEPEPPDRPAV